MSIAGIASRAAFTRRYVVVSRVPCAAARVVMSRLMIKARIGTPMSRASMINRSGKRLWSIHGSNETTCNILDSGGCVNQRESIHAAVGRNAEETTPVLSVFFKNISHARIAGTSYRVVAFAECSRGRRRPVGLTGSRKIGYIAEVTGEEGGIVGLQMVGLRP